MTNCPTQSIRKDNEGYPMVEIEKFIVTGAFIIAPKRHCRYQAGILHKNAVLLAQVAFICLFFKELKIKQLPIPVIRKFSKELFVMIKNADNYFKVTKSVFFCGY